jgi:hypothetical protein
MRLFKYRNATFHPNDWSFQKSSKINFQIGSHRLSTDLFLKNKNKHIYISVTPTFCDDGGDDKRVHASTDGGWGWCRWGGGGRGGAPTTRSCDGENGGGVSWQHPVAKKKWKGRARQLRVAAPSIGEENERAADRSSGV